MYRIDNVSAGIGSALRSGGAGNSGRGGISLRYTGNFNSRSRKQNIITIVRTKLIVCWNILFLPREGIYSTQNRTGSGKKYLRKGTGIPQSERESVSCIQILYSSCNVRFLLSGKYDLSKSRCLREGKKTLSYRRNSTKSRMIHVMHISIAVHICSLP